jgi:DNA-binding XRE family transcriptional regulator
MESTTRKDTKQNNRAGNAGQTPNQAAELNAFMLAVNVMRSSLQSLPSQDHRDMFELLPDLLGHDSEERDSAIEAVREIFCPPVGTITPMELPIGPSQELENWKAFVGRTIREQREKAGLTQTQLAKKTGIDQGHLSDLEKGRHSPNAKTLERIAAGLGIDVSVLDPSLKSSD